MSTPQPNAFINMYTNKVTSIILKFIHLFLFFILSHKKLLNDMHCRLKYEGFTI